MKYALKCNEFTSIMEHACTTHDGRRIANTHLKALTNKLVALMRELAREESCDG